MNAAIFIEETQALLAGRNEWGNIIIDFNPADLNQAQREELARCDKVYLPKKAIGDQEHFFSPNYRHDGLSTIKPAVADFETLELLLNDRIENRAKREKEKIEKEIQIAKTNVERIEQWAAQPIENCIVSRQNIINARKLGIIWPSIINFSNEATTREYAKNHPHVAERIEDIESLIFWEWADLKAMEAFKARKQRQERIETEQAAQQWIEEKEKQLSQWVLEHGTENQKARFKEGFLSYTEITDCIRKQVFLPLANEPRFQKITADQVRKFCDNDDYSECYNESHKIEFSTHEKEKLTATEFDRLVYLRKLIPSATVTVKTHEGFCTVEDCPAKLERLSYHVEIKVGALTLSREYGDL